MAGPCSSTLAFLPRQLHQQQLGEVVDTEDPDLFEEFLRSAAPNYETYFEEEAMKLRRQIIQQVVRA